LKEFIEERWDEKRTPLKGGGRAQRQRQKSGKAKKRKSKPFNGRTAGWMDGWTD